VPGRVARRSAGLGAARPTRGRVLKRPPGLRLVRLEGPFYRFDRTPSSAWDWTPHPTPRYRFDSSLVRVRYAATTAHGAARERYRDTGSYIPPDHAGHYLVTLTGALSVLDLRKDAILDALGLDDRISTGHETDIWHRAQHLTELALGWFGERLEGIVYRSRTTPETSANLAFFSHSPLRARSIRLDRARRLLDELIIRHGFTVDIQ
jgi:RES domain